MTAAELTLVVAIVAIDRLPEIARIITADRAAKRRHEVAVAKEKGGQQG